MTKTAKLQFGCTSGTGLFGDWRSMTLGLVFLGVLLDLFEEDTVSDSNPVVLSLRTARGEIF